jgi:hypothetical protein
MQVAGRHAFHAVERQHAKMSAETISKRKITERVRGIMTLDGIESEVSQLNLLDDIVRIIQPG